MAGLVVIAGLNHSPGWCPTRTDAGRASALRAALATREMGAVIHAYRTHGWHGQPLTQRQIAGWGGFNQAYVSRVESGLARIDDLNGLTHWARVLSIPAHLLWFAPPHSRAGTGAGGPVGAILDRRSPGERRDEPTDRRDVVRLGGAVTAGLTGGALAAQLATEPDFMHTALDTGTLGEDRLASLEDTARRLGLLTVTASESTTSWPRPVTGSTWSGSFSPNANARPTRFAWCVRQPGSPP